MKLKILLVFTYLLITVFLFVVFDALITVKISFFVNALVLFFITLFHIFEEKDYSPFMSSFIVFSFLFFLASPILQISTFEGVNKEFMTRYPYKEAEVIFTNILIFVFNIVFFVSYIFLKRIKTLCKVPKVPKVPKESLQILPVSIVFIAILCVIIFLASLNFVFYEIERPSWMPSNFPKSAALFWKKLFFLLPFAGIILCYQYFNKQHKKAINLFTIIFFLLFFLVLLLWFKNPLIEKRNALGPIYISLIFLFVPKLLNTNIKTLFFLFFSMIIVFPFTAILTHTDASFQELLKNPSLLFDEDNKGGGVLSTFNTLNYDAFANIMATKDYIMHNGYSYGEQFLSAFLFFVPRSIWEGKPISTGQLVGEHLMDDYGFTYSNLSNPLVSEGYINFGIFGVILTAIGLAITMVKLISWIKSDDYLKKVMAFYFGIHLIFLLRGDFANGFSYYIGTFIGVIIIPKMIEYFIKFLLIHQQRWKKSKTTKSLS